MWKILHQIVFYSYLNRRFSLGKFLSGGEIIFFTIGYEKDKNAIECTSFSLTNGVEKVTIKTWSDVEYAFNCGWLEKVTGMYDLELAREDLEQFISIYIDSSMTIESCQLIPFEQF